MSYIGPALPPHLRGNPPDNQDDSSEDDAYGPALPPHLKLAKKQDTSSDSDDTYGPALPPSLKRHIPRDENVAGPSSAIQHSESEPSSDEDIVGPMPSDAGITNFELERRALMMKRKLVEGGDEVPEKAKREDWMIELPELHKKNFGLGPRTFSNTKGPEITGRDQWTSVQGKDLAPEKKKEKKPPLEYYEQQKNEKLDKIVEEYNSAKRSESLLKAHQKELKKKQKEEQADKTKERKPFNRDEDMKLNKLDSARKKELIKKSSELNTKFKSGGSKFL